jgi:hypothetical protein
MDKQMTVTIKDFGGAASYIEFEVDGIKKVYNYMSIDQRKDDAGFQTMIITFSDQKKKHE